MTKHTWPETKLPRLVSWDWLERNLADVILAADKSQPKGRAKPLLRLLLTNRNLSLPKTREVLKHAGLRAKPR